MNIEMLSPEDNGWMPISQAPHDMTEVMLFAPEEDPPIFTGMFINEWCRSSSGSYKPNDDYFGDGTINPTHWQPLPPPPTKELT